MRNGRMPRFGHHQAKPQTILRGFATALHPRHLVPSLTAGLIVGVLETVLAVSFAALIFSGDLSSFVAQGIGLALAGAVVSTALVALLSTLPGTISGNQDIPAAIMAVMAAGIVATLSGGASGQAALPTVVVAVALTTLLTGAFMFALGYLKLGNLVRFLPYPVVGGFMAGTGWLLVIGAVGLMVDFTPSLAQLNALLGVGVLLRWLPGLLFAISLMVALHRFDHFLVLPGMLVAAVGLFYGFVWLSGVPFDQLSAQGWLLGPFPSSSLWQPLSWGDLAQVDWPTIAAQLPSMITILLVSAVALLLNASGLEVAVRRDVALNRELRAAGLGNLLAGLAGGLVGYHILSLSILGIGAGGGKRLVGLVAAAVCLFSLVAGAAFLSLFPKVVVGGLLLFLGLTFLKEWAYDAWFRLPRIDYLIVIFILFVIATVGFLEGVAVGVVVAMILFVITYTRVDVVRADLTGQHLSSRVSRSREVRQQLRQEGEKLYILQLQGFIFFGTAERLLNRIRQRVQAADLPQLQFVLLDFRRVTGLDSTAAFSFVKLQQLMAAQGTTLVITETTPNIHSRLVKGGLAPSQTVLHFQSLDGGLEWCENEWLRRVEPAPVTASASLAAQLAAILPGEDDVNALLPYLSRQVMNPGEYLIRQGEPSNKLYFVESGQVTAELEYANRAPVRLETMGRGHVVGELGFFLQHTRTASVVADLPSTIHFLTRQDVARMEREDPRASLALHRLIIRLLSERVTHLVSTVSALEQ